MTDPIRIRKTRQNSEIQRRRDNAKSTKQKRAWYKAYRKRIADGLEYCRRCGSKDDLIFGHKIPSVLGGTYAKHNIVIMCKSCDYLNGRRILNLPSLAEEEGS
jgi:5-methylcytosine-specific restriction endonuclease McrA